MAHGLPAVNILGIADTAIRESKERVKATIRNSGFKWPAERITVSLTPSDMRKEGASFDLAVALGILAASEQINQKYLKNYFILAEMALDGSLRSIWAALPASLAAGVSRINNLIIPLQNTKEAAVAKNTNVSGGMYMKKRFMEEQIAYALKRHETGITTKDICREMGYRKRHFTSG